MRRSTGLGSPLEPASTYSSVLPRPVPACMRRSLLSARLPKHVGLRIAMTRNAPGRWPGACDKAQGATPTLASHDPYNRKQTSAYHQLGEPLIAMDPKGW